MGMENSWCALIYLCIIMRGCLIVLMMRWRCTFFLSFFFFINFRTAGLNKFSAQSRKYVILARSLFLLFFLRIGKTYGTVVKNYTFFEREKFFWFNQVQKPVTKSEYFEKFMKWEKKRFIDREILEIHLVA